MMRLMTGLSAVGMLLFLCGCPKNYSFSEAVYQGVQTRDSLNATPIERAQSPELSYPQYEAERKRLQ